jgi:anti-sigma B factor antagonist
LPPGRESIIFGAIDSHEGIERARIHKPEVEMKIKERQNGDVTVLEISGKVQGGPDDDVFRQTITNLVESGKTKVLLDLSDVPWMNSTGVGIIVSGFTTITNAGGQVKLLNVKERVKSILMVTRLLSVFESYYHEEDAIKSFKD